MQIKSLQNIIKIQKLLKNKLTDALDLLKWVYWQNDFLAFS